LCPPAKPSDIATDFRHLAGNAVVVVRLGVGQGTNCLRGNAIDSPCAKERRRASLTHKERTAIPRAESQFSSSGQSSPPRRTGAQIAEPAASPLVVAGWRAESMQNLRLIASQPWERAQTQPSTIEPAEQHLGIESSGLQLRDHCEVLFIGAASTLPSLLVARNASVCIVDRS